ncbi:CpsD/CapB family tyrosine-protein kinase [Patulibacter sp.]|uniref:CpsD/CapB family tyrosine-protein kinase n=1 Tax=Patulibacter sp. TaxID=1912859 RepID=UPI00271C2FFF|nr:CpsD/CapB family tyrosine-protein kinase [Patulibacter sp.]MDO9410338.1 CpsD/CapB family tyrosine-protein kinase [Patulibacter sp.]
MTRRTLTLALLVLAAVLVGAAVGLLSVTDRPSWAGLLGGLVGLLLGGGGVALALRSSKALTDGADAQRVAGLPLVAHVPPPAAGEDDRRRADEAFRMLRAALVPAPGAPAGTHLSVVVTSAAPGEGKTTVAAGLSRALSRAGRPVVAVEADLRRPALAAALGVPSPPARGLTAAIVGGVPVAELLVEVSPGLRLLPAGELPPNAPELLGSADAARVLAELDALGVDVVLDTAPLLPVADTRELLVHAPTHRVVLVARPGVADRGELRSAVDLLPGSERTILAVSGRSPAPRSYDRYLREGERA